MTERELIERLRDALQRYAHANHQEHRAGWLNHKLIVDPSVQKSALAVLAEVDAYLAGTAASAEGDWRPTSENVNALPDPIRRFIHELEAECDPAGTIRAKVLLEDTVRQLAAQLRETQAATRRECAEQLNNVIGAADNEGELTLDGQARLEALAFSWRSTPAAPAPDPAAQGACRRCSDCEGERHHWTEDPRVTDPSDWACRHCDTRGVSCPDCELEEREDCELCGGCGVVEIAGHNPEPAPGGEEGGR